MTSALRRRLRGKKELDIYLHDMCRVSVVSAASSGQLRYFVICLLSSEPHAYAGVWAASSTVRLDRDAEACPRI